MTKLELPEEEKNHKAREEEKSFKKSVINPNYLYLAKYKERTLKVMEVECLRTSKSAIIQKES